MRSEGSAPLDIAVPHQCLVPPVNRCRWLLSCRRLTDRASLCLFADPSSPTTSNRGSRRLTQSFATTRVIVALASCLLAASRRANGSLRHSPSIAQERLAGLHEGGMPSSRLIDEAPSIVQAGGISGVLIRLTLTPIRPKSSCPFSVTWLGKRGLLRTIRFALRTEVLPWCSRPV